MPRARREPPFSSTDVGAAVAMDLGWSGFAAPGNPRAQLSVIRHDASAAGPPDVSLEVDDVDDVTRRRRAGTRSCTP